MIATQSWSSFFGKGDGRRPRPWAVVLCAALLGICSAHVEIAGIFAACAVGTLFTLNSPAQVRILLALFILGLIIDPKPQTSLSYWLVTAQTAVTACTPRHLASKVMLLPRWAWQIGAILAAISICAMLLGNWPIATIVAQLTSFYLGANIARQLAFTDARLLTWGDEGLVAVTRDLLLGRVTSGMLHDLAQPLNVISMANGNMRYIVEHLAIEDEERQPLLERIDRIAQHTQNTASILSLFRWFGRDGSDDPAQLTVRTALKRAIAATRSNVRHHDVEVELQGDGLDYLLPTRHGSLEIIAVAALLCAFASFSAAEGTKKRGKIVLQATLSPAHVVVRVQCTDDAGHSTPVKTMDHATAWLVEQVAHEASGDFRMLLDNPDRMHFLIRLGRDDG